MWWFLVQSTQRLGAWCAVGDLLKTIPDTGRWEVMLSTGLAERRADLKPVVRGKELQTQTTTDTFFLPTTHRIHRGCHGQLQGAATEGVLTENQTRGIA